MRRRRGLSEEERTLWLHVAQSARPMHPGPAPRDTAADSAMKAGSKAAPDIPQEEIPRFMLGEKVRTSAKHDLVPALPERLRAGGLQMDRRLFDQMSRGKLRPEGRIDLHGMTLSEAHPELVRFVLSSAARGLRLILVITGKGKPGSDHGPIPVRSGALRHQVPQWLTMAPIGPLVQQVVLAHGRHGGSGAYYVYLRRSRGQK